MTFSDIVESTQNVSDLISNMAAASHQQTNGAQRASKSMADIELATQQNAELVEEATTASNALKQETHRLSEMMSFFTVSAHNQADNDATEDNVANNAGHNNGIGNIHFISRH